MTAALLPVTSLPPRGRQRRRRVPTPVLLASLAVALLLLYMAEQQARGRMLLLHAPLAFAHNLSAVIVRRCGVVIASFGGSGCGQRLLWR